MYDQVIDGRCTCPSCEKRTARTYEMNSHPCSNCGAGPFILTFRAGDEARPLPCPVCEVSRAVSPNRVRLREAADGE